MRRRISFAGLGLAAALALCAGRARACGVSGCDLVEHNEAAHPWRVGASGVYTSTALRFGGSDRGDQTRGAAFATLARRLSKRWTFTGEVGVAFGGELRMPDGVHRFDPGATGAVGASYRWLDGRPFLILTSLLSFSAARTHRDGANDSANYEAYDLRAGALFGTTLFDALSPYAIARVFGGPVFWRYQGSATTGTDVSHYQLGAGLSLDAGKRVTIIVEGIPLGERAVSGGIAVGF